MPVTSETSADGKTITLHISGQFNFSLYQEFRAVSPPEAVSPGVRLVLDLAGTE